MDDKARYGIEDHGSGPYFSLTGSVWHATPNGHFRKEPDICGQVTDYVRAAFHVAQPDGAGTSA